MIPTYILIVAIAASPTMEAGVAIDHVEFIGKRACVAASEAVVSSAIANKKAHIYVAKCVPKSLEKPL